MAEQRSLGEGRKPMVRPHYPHMLAQDNAVWTKFLLRDAERVKEVWYDVRVGAPVFLPASATIAERKIAEGLTRKRIDAVCIVDGNYWVVEVKPYAGMQAVGQIISYARLFAMEYLTTGRVIPVIVCDEIDGDLLPEFEELGILVVQND